MHSRFAFLKYSHYRILVRTCILYFVRASRCFLHHLPSVCLQSVLYDIFTLFIVYLLHTILLIHFSRLMYLFILFSRQNFHFKTCVCFIYQFFYTVICTCYFSFPHITIACLCAIHFSTFCLFLFSRTLSKLCLSVLRPWKRGTLMWTLRSLVYLLMVSATYQILTSTRLCLSMAESLADDARHKHHSKAAFLLAAVQTLRTHLAKSTQLFQAYFLALFADKDYTKVLDSIAKVDKSLRSESTRPQRNSPTTRYRAVVCYECGRPGHTAPRCYLRRNPPPGSIGGNRPFLYQRPSRGRPSN